MNKLIFLLALLIFPCVVYADLTLTAGEGVDVTKDGSTVVVAGEDATTTNKGIASFNASDFDLTSGAVSFDYTNGQAASSSVKGLLTSTDWSTFNGKQSALTEGTDYFAPASLLESIVFFFKSFGQAIASGTSIYKPIPYNCTITSWEVTGDTGSTVIDILKSDYATMGTWVSIAGTEIPNTSSAIKGTDTSLTTWNTTLVAGQYLMANVTSSDVVGNAKVVLKLKRR